MFYRSLYSEGQVEVDSRGILKEDPVEKIGSTDMGGGGGLEKKILIEIINFL